MKTVVLEPHTEYKVSGWLPSPDIYPIDQYILNIENNTISFCPPSSSVQLFIGKRSARKLSSLRGKMTKQNENEIDDQISHLRNEWERDI